VKPKGQGGFWRARRTFGCLLETAIFRDLYLLATVRLASGGRHLTNRRFRRIFLSEQK
jgi:hypothetical protein